MKATVNNNRPLAQAPSTSDQKGQFPLKKDPPIVVQRAKSLPVHQKNIRSTKSIYKQKAYSRSVHSAGRASGSKKSSLPLSYEGGVSEKLNLLSDTTEDDREKSAGARRLRHRASSALCKLKAGSSKFLKRVGHAVVDYLAVREEDRELYVSSTKAPLH